MPDVLIIGLAVYLGLALLAALVIFPALIAASRADDLTHAILSRSSADIGTSVRGFAGLRVRSLSAGPS
jgi:pyruvate/2-oxoglutarate dehydrogenase complex dihydrolipoamide acyltransferase (E2) component